MAHNAWLIMHGSQCMAHNAWLRNMRERPAPHRDACFVCALLLQTVMQQKDVLMHFSYPGSSFDVVAAPIYDEVRDVMEGRDGELSKETLYAINADTRSPETPETPETPVSDAKRDITHDHPGSPETSETPTDI